MTNEVSSFAEAASRRDEANKLDRHGANAPRDDKPGLQTRHGRGAAKHFFRDYIRRHLIASL
jgi:hypothetical protein